MITIASFPLAPSTNESYFALRSQGGRLVPSQVLKAFERSVKGWASARPDTVESIQRELRGWLAGGFMIRVDAFFVFQRSRLWTLDGYAHKLDANNRLKPALDGLVLALGIDDSVFWGGRCEKVQCDLIAEQRTVFVLQPHRPQTLAGLAADLGFAFEDFPPVIVEPPKYKRKKSKR